MSENSEDRLVAPGSFCWNPECGEYGRVGGDTVRKFGLTRRGVQRYQCRACKRTFTETKGTVFYGRHHSQETILECLALLAERNSLAALHRVKGIKEETATAWLEEAAAHIEQVEALLLARYPLSRVQLDALWTYVGHKGEKGGTPKRPSGAPSGGGALSIPTVG